MVIGDFDGNVGYDGMFVLLYGTAAITAGNWVAIDSTNTANPQGVVGYSVRTAVNTNADALSGICGIAAQTTTAAGMLRVQVKGRYNSANVANAVNAAGLGIVCSSSSGRADLASAQSTDDYRLCGYSLAAASGNLADVQIVPHPFFAD
jgi:hypothetical protein